MQPFTWAELKPGTPYGALPVLEIAGNGRLAQSNGIVRCIGREHGLPPERPVASRRARGTDAAIEPVASVQR